MLNSVPLIFLESVSLHRDFGPDTLNDSNTENVIEGPIKLLPGTKILQLIHAIFVHTDLIFIMFLIL